MIIKDKDLVLIDIDSEQLAKSIALLTDLRDFCKEQTETDEGKAEKVSALNTAIETMLAFWAEHFDEMEVADDHPQE